MNIFTWITNLFKKPDKTEIDWPGCLPPLTDFRDVLGSVLLQETPLPTSYNIPYRLKVKDQDGRPICVAASSSLAKEERELRENIDIEFDPDWLYAEAKKIDNYPGDGTYLNIPLKIMMNKGIKVLGGSEADVGKFRIGGYLRLDDLTPNGLKKAIYKWGIVIAGFNFSRQGWATEYIRPPKIGEATTGHAVALLGWDPTYIIGQNSFGQNWGREGMFFLPKDYMPFGAYAILTDLPDNWQELLDIGIPKPQYVFKNNLAYGMTNDEVVILQDALKFFGCLSKSQESTGYYGQMTKDAIILFQKRYGISQTGFFGNLTRAKMNELLL